MLALNYMATLKNFSHEIDQNFPDFLASINPKVYDNSDRDKAYVYVEQFAHYLCEKIDKAEQSDPWVKKAFEFINRTYNQSSDLDLNGLIRISFFDKFAENSTYESLALRYLNGQALEYFKHQAEGPGTNSPKEFIWPG